MEISDYLVTRFFYKQLHFQRLRLRFDQKLSNFCRNIKYYQKIIASNEKTHFEKMLSNSEAELENGVAYKKKCIVTIMSRFSHNETNKMQRTLLDRMLIGRWKTTHVTDS